MRFRPLFVATIAALLAACAPSPTDPVPTGTPNLDGTAPADSAKGGGLGSGNGG